MELIEIGPLSAAQRTELEGDEVDPFGSTGSELQWQPKDFHVVLRDSDRRLVAAAGWLIADVEVAGEVIPVVGIGGVIVSLPHRGLGLGRRVIGAALERVERLGPEFAMLFCQPDRVGLYQRRGFVLIEEPVVVEQAEGPVEVPLEVMWRPLREGCTFPKGQVRVLGPPF